MKECLLSLITLISSSKASADILVRLSYQTHKYPLIITRSSHNYGPVQSFYKNELNNTQQEAVRSVISRYKPKVIHSYFRFYSCRNVKLMVISHLKSMEAGRVILLKPQLKLMQGLFILVVYLHRSLTDRRILNKNVDSRV